MAFTSLAVRILQVLCILTSLALIVVCRVIYADQEDRVNSIYLVYEGFLLGIFATAWYGMLLAVSFSRLSSPQHLGRVIILSIDILVNVTLFFHGADVIENIVAFLLENKNGPTTGALALASIFCTFVFAEIGFDVVRVLQYLNQRSFTLQSSNYPAISEFEQPGV